jgi:hypothetical protein
MAARQLRDASGLLVPAVRESIAALRLGPEHAGLCALALALAADLDAADSEHRPRLYAQMMKALGMLGRPPRQAGAAGPSGLERLRQAHRTMTPGSA